MKSTKRTLWGLILCNVLGIHNRREQSRTGVVKYCSRCHCITKDARRRAKAAA